MTTEPRRSNPAFHILEPNQLLGNRTMVLINPEFSRSICDLILNTELTPDQKHLYAFAKRLRAHYYQMSQMYQRLNGQPENADGALDEVVAAG